MSETNNPTAVNQHNQPESLYDRVGGHETFALLVHYFYEEVSRNSVLRPMYPEEDLAPAERRLLLFLEQYWGGPKTYSLERGHPRLRMRHHPFPITYQASQTWLSCMDTALEKLANRIGATEQAELRQYFSMAAFSLINSDP